MRGSMIAAAMVAVLVTTAVAQDEAAVAAEVELQAEYDAWAEAFEASLDRQQGRIEIAGGAVRLTVPDAYYYLNAADAQRVLVDAWGNPEGDAPLGMIFPAGLSPLDAESYGVELTFDRDGYVSDADAARIDYDDLLRDMKRATREENAWRRQNGFGDVELVGWAEAPTYDAAQHEMVWAKHLRFEADAEGGSATEILNYNVRALGRRGVLNANFIAGIEQLAEVRVAAPDVLAMIEFTEGNRYADFRQGDRVAAYGLAGMVAGGAVLAKKTGLAALLLMFAKKFGVVALAGAAGLFGVVRKAFGAKG